MFCHPRQVDINLATNPVLGVGAAVAAFDVGGTDLKAALIDPSGRIRSVLRRPMVHRDEHAAESVLSEMATILSHFAVEYPWIVPQAVGLVIPGIVDETNGVGVASENLGWRNVPFRLLGERLLQLPVSVGHDVRAAGKAEKKLGAAQAYDDVVVIVIGTGICAAVFVEGRPYAGGGFAGEIGHAILDPSGPLCACGGHGCLETIASAGAIARTYIARTSEQVSGAKEVLSRAQGGDPVAREIWNRALDALALHLSQMVALLGPQAIVIGGGLAQAGDALFSPLEHRLNALLTFQRRPVLRPALIGENAGVIGAALRARELLPKPQG